VGSDLVQVSTHACDPVGARDARLRADLKAIAQAGRLYRVNTGRWPRSLHDLLVPSEEVLAKWRGPYLAELPRDPWGNPYRLFGRGDGSFALVSLGADGLAGGAEEAADLALLSDRAGPR
jgi:general secretion pathway protein G